MRGGGTSCNIEPREDDLGNRGKSLSERKEVYLIIRGKEIPYKVS